ncbi:hypothetical protein B0G38_000852 [Arthrobacter sp. VKM Ac-2550]|nr:hypothetical protein [Arthrobacter sp. VKM Ac-2550]
MVQSSLDNSRRTPIVQTPSGQIEPRQSCRHSLHKEAPLVAQQAAARINAKPETTTGTASKEPKQPRSIHAAQPHVIRTANRGVKRKGKRSGTARAAGWKAERHHAGEASRCTGSPKRRERQRPKRRRPGGAAASSPQRTTETKTTRHQGERIGTRTATRNGSLSGEARQRRTLLTYGPPLHSADKNFPMARP